MASQPRPALGSATCHTSAPAGAGNQQPLPENSSCLKQFRIRTRSFTTPVSRKRHTTCNLGCLPARCASVIPATSGTKWSSAANLSTRAIARRTGPRLAPDTRPPSSASTSNFRMRGDRPDPRACVSAPPSLLPSCGMDERQLKVFTCRHPASITSASRQASTTQPHCGTKTWSNLWAQLSPPTRK